MIVAEGIFTELVKEKYPATEEYYKDMACTCAISADDLYLAHGNMAVKGMALSNGPITENELIAAGIHYAKNPSPRRA